MTSHDRGAAVARLFYDPLIVAHRPCDVRTHLMPVARPSFYTFTITYNDPCYHLFYIAWADFYIESCISYICCTTCLRQSCNLRAMSPRQVCDVFKTSLRRISLATAVGNRTTLTWPCIVKPPWETYCNVTALKCQTSHDCRERFLYLRSSTSWQNRTIFKFLRRMLQWPKHRESLVWNAPFWTFL